ncbi:MAG: hypothetical protein AB7N71_03650, partial [Phycisphaerae bacterium]
QAICHETPQLPSVSAAQHRGNGVIPPRALRGDLDNIVMTALRKSPSRRYRSVQAFGEDIDRFFNGQPVLARKDTRSYRTWKFVRRNRVAVSAVLIGVIALIAGIIGLSVGLRQARTDRARALAAVSEAEAVMGFFGDTLARANPYVSRGKASLLDLLEDAEARVDREYRRMPGVEARVRLTIAKSYAGLWRWEKARDQAARAVRLFQSDGNTDPALLVDSLLLLSRAYSFSNDGNALRISKRALSNARAVHGEQSPEFAEALGLLGFAYWTSTAAASPDAESNYRASLNLFEKLEDRWSAARARICFSYAMYLRAINRHVEAEPYLYAALSYFRSEIPSRDLYLVECLYMYSKLLFEIGQFGDAELFLDECIDRIPESFVRQKAIDAHMSLAYIYFEEGCFEQAEAQFKKTVERYLVMNVDDCTCAFSQTVSPAALSLFETIDLNDDKRFALYQTGYEMCHAAPCLDHLLLERCIHNMFASAINHRNQLDLWDQLVECRKDITERILGDKDVTVQY